MPLKQGDAIIPKDDNGSSRVRLGGWLERQMRERWQTVSALCETNKAPANRLNLLEQIDYLHKLSSQLEWQLDSKSRLAYSSSGTLRWPLKV